MTDEFSFGPLINIEEMMRGELESTSKHMTSMVVAVVLSNINILPAFFFAKLIWDMT